MEPYKLFLLAKKLHPSLRTKVPSVICQLILKDTHYEPIRNLLTGKQIIILSFLINGLNRTEDISSLYEQIMGNMFVFSIVEVEDETPEDGCQSCGGDGKLRCNNCNGNGEVDCEDCDGDGEIYSSDEDGGGPCDTCQGGGRVECEQCGSEGEETCQECDGSGSISKYDYVTITQDYYVSYDTKIYSLLETKDEESDMGYEIDHKITKSSRTFIFDSLDGNTDKLPKESSNGDRIFVGVDKGDVEFGKGHNVLIDYNNLEHLVVE